MWNRIESSVTANNILSIVLNEPDFTTAARLSVINQVYGGQTARAVDQATIELAVPWLSAAIVGFIAQIEELPIQPDTNAG